MTIITKTDNTLSSNKQYLDSLSNLDNLLRNFTKNENYDLSVDKKINKIIEKFFKNKSVKTINFYCLKEKIKEKFLNKNINYSNELDNYIQFKMTEKLELKLCKSGYDLKLADPIFFSTLEQIKLFSLFNPSSINEKDKNGFTPLHLACLVDRLDVVEYLLKTKADVFALNINNFSPLHIAIGLGHYAIAQVIISYQKKINDPINLHKILLHPACEKITSKFLKFLIKNGASITVLDDSKNSLLHIASRENQLIFAQALLDNGADCNQPNSQGNYPIHLACQHKNLKMITLLMSYGAKCARLDSKKNYPLHDAIKSKNEELTRVLLKNSNDLNLLDKNLNTTLHLACIYGNEELISSLKGKIEDYEKPNQFGRTPFHHLCQRNDLFPLIKGLIDEGININCKTKNGETPLLSACSAEQEKVVELLLNQKANVQCINEAGDSPYSLIMASNFIKKNEWLEKIEKLDDGLTEELLGQQMLAHQFSLKGNLTGTLLGTTFGLLGMHNEHAIHFLTQHLDNYISSNAFNTILQGEWQSLQKMSLPPPKNMQAILIDILKETKSIIEKACDHQMLTTDEIVQQIEKNNVTCFLGGWEEHTVSWGYYKYYSSDLSNTFNYHVFRSNKGDWDLPHLKINEIPSGICFNKIKNIDNLLIITEKFKKITGSIFLNDMRVDLALENFFFIKQPFQKTTNCAVASSHAMEIAILTALILPHVNNNHNDAIPIAMAIHHHRKHYSRFEDLKRYLNHHPNPKDECWPINQELIEEIDKKMASILKDQQTFKDKPRRIEEAHKICELIKNWKKMFVEFNTH